MARVEGVTAGVDGGLHELYPARRDATSETWHAIRKCAERGVGDFGLRVEVITVHSNRHTT